MDESYVYVYTRMRLNNNYDKHLLTATNINDMSSPII